MSERASVHPAPRPKARGSYEVRRRRSRTQFGVPSQDERQAGSVGLFGWRVVRSRITYSSATVSRRTHGCERVRTVAGFRSRHGNIPWPTPDVPSVHSLARMLSATIGGANGNSAQRRACAFQHQASSRSERNRPTSAEGLDDSPLAKTGRRLLHAGSRCLEPRSVGRSRLGRPATRSVLRRWTLHRRPQEQCRCRAGHRSRSRGEGTSFRRDRSRG